MNATKLFLFSNLCLMKYEGVNLVIYQVESIEIHQVLK